MRKLFLCTILFIFPAFLVLCQEYVIAVSDFSVESDKADYKYIGKGISRLVASELRKSGRVTLVEREHFNKILEEQELSLSDLMDESRQVRIGKLLSANYLVVGEIIDMGAPGILISVRLVNADTGAVAWQGEKQEKLAVYDYLGAYFAQSLLEPLNVNPAEATVAKVEKKEEKAPAAIIKTSEGIDAYDRRDTAVAKEALEVAKAIDPTNDVAAEYLAKLVTNTAKFKTLPEPYFSDQNPAYLGIIRTDKLYLMTSWPLQLLVGGISNPPMMELPSGVRLWEHDFRVKLGYTFPVGENFGLDILGVWYGSQHSTSTLVSYNSGLGGMVNAGLALSDTLSLGLGVTVYAESNRGGIPFAYTPDIHPALAFSAGVLIRNTDETIGYDALVGYCSGRREFYTLGVLTSSFSLPLFLEHTLTIALNQKSTFLIVNQLNDVTLDRAFYNGRIVPAFEQFIADWISLRVALEGSLTVSGSNLAFGYGIMGGLTLRIVGWGLDLNVNVVYRLRPSKIIEDVMFPDLIGTFSITLDDLFVSRKK